jgi:hypothetical protein
LTLIGWRPIISYVKAYTPSSLRGLGKQGCLKRVALLFSIMITNFYVDAFNLYYGCLKGTSYKWLNLEHLCQLSFPNDQVHRIRYFTARVKARPSDPQQPARQASYLRALATLPCVSIHYGHYLQTPVFMPYANPPAHGPSTVQVLKSEEKGSDVNLATMLLVDAFDRDFEKAVVVERWRFGLAGRHCAEKV